MKINIILSLFFLFPVSYDTWSQTLQLIPGQSTVTIQGTSTLHNWEEKVEKFDMNLSVKMINQQVSAIDQANFSCQSSSVVADNSLMTSKTHDALKTDKYPAITFRLISVDNLNAQGNTFSGKASGDISMAGITRRVNIDFQGTSQDHKITLKGSKELNMNDYKIKPPTAMFGTLKSGEQVTISFTFLFQVS